MQRYYKDRNTIKIILCKLSFIFFRKISEEQEKEAGTNFVLFSCSRNMIHTNKCGWTNQDSAIFPTQENTKMFNITSKYFSIFNNVPLAS